MTHSPRWGVVIFLICNLWIHPIEKNLDHGCQLSTRVGDRHLACIEAEITISNNCGINCEKWTIKHDAPLSWARERIQEARNEREGMKVTIEELTEQLKQLTARLYQGEVRVKSLEGVCTFQAADLPGTSSRI